MSAVKAGQALTWALVLGAGAWWARWQILQAATFRHQWGHDLAFFHQILSSAAAGRAWASPILLEPTGFFQMVHFHPVFVALVPLVAASPGVETLLTVNVAAVAGVGWALAGLATAVSGRWWAGPLAAAAWLVWAPTEAAALNDFRPAELLGTGLALTAWGVAARRPALWLAGVALTCSAREESAYLLGALGLIWLVVPFDGWRRREGLAVAGLAAAWFAFMALTRPALFFHFNPVAVLQGLGEPGPEVPAELVTERIRFLRGVACSGYLGGPLTPSLVLAAAGPAWQLWTDTHREWHGVLGPYVHLRTPMLALWACAGTATVAWVCRRRARVGAGLFALMVLANALALPEDRQRLRRQRESVLEASRSVEVEALRALVAGVPSDARVGTDYRLIAALSGREVLWNTAHMNLTDPRPAHWRGPWPVTVERLDTLLVPEDDPVLASLPEGWSRRDPVVGYVLATRDVAPEAWPPEPVPDAPGWAWWGGR